MERRRARRIPGGEELDRLRLASFFDLEIVGRQPRYRAALFVGEDNAKVNEIDGSAERLLRASNSSHRDEAERQNDGTSHVYA